MAIFVSAPQVYAYIATINKEPLIVMMKGSESGGYLLSHGIPQCSTIGDAVSLSFRATIGRTRL